MTGPMAAFVVNGTRAPRLASLQARLAAAAAAGWAEPLILLTTPQDGGLAMTREAIEAGAAVVFAVGGDGTVRACAQELANTGVPLAIVPLGSANLTARSLGVPRDTGAALAVGFGGMDAQIDLLLADGQVCAAMAGIGLDAAVVGATSDALKRRTGWPAYAAASVGQLLGPPAEFSIELDGGTPMTRRARSVFVGNCGLLPGGFPILPDARPDDGVLDVGILAPRSMAGWVSVGYRAVLGSRRDDDQLARYRARTVLVQAAAVLPRQIDGEVMAPAADLRVTVLPGALRVRVPARRARRSG
jgi:diacylglycerol kinase family enzyme